MTIEIFSESKNSSRSVLVRAASVGGGHSGVCRCLKGQEGEGGVGKSGASSSGGLAAELDILEIRSLAIY